MPYEVEILGQKAKIANITAHAKSVWWPAWWPADEDWFLVSILFDAPIDGLGLMQVQLPIHQYEPAEFLHAVKQKAEINILEARKDGAKAKAFAEEIKQHKIELETMAGRLRDLFGIVQ